jgi:hypothetical protein
MRLPNWLNPRKIGSRKKRPASVPRTIVSAIDLDKLPPEVREQLVGGLAGLVAAAGEGGAHPVGHHCRCVNCWVAWTVATVIHARQIHEGRGDDDVDGEAVEAAAERLINAVRGNRQPGSKMSPGDFRLLVESTLRWAGEQLAPAPDRTATH